MGRKISIWGNDWAEDINAYNSLDSSYWACFSQKWITIEDDLADCIVSMEHVPAGNSMFRPEIAISGPEILIMTSTSFHLAPSLSCLAPLIPPLKPTIPTLDIYDRHAKYLSPMRKKSAQHSHPPLPRAGARRGPQEVSRLGTLKTRFFFEHIPLTLTSNL